jgi:hypothetical protein
LAGNAVKIKRSPSGEATGENARTLVSTVPDGSVIKSMQYLHLLIFHKLAAHELAEEKGADHRWESRQMPAQAGEDAASDHYWDGKMNCQYPLG